MIDAENSVPNQGLHRRANILIAFHAIYLAALVYLALKASEILVP
jgi:hypothetical protein